MNKIQNIENLPLLKYNNSNDQIKSQISTDIVKNDLFVGKDKDNDLSTIPMIFNDFNDEKEELLNDIDIFKDEQKIQLNNNNKFINKKRKRRANPKLYSRKNDNNTLIELIQYKKEKANNSNINSPFELEYCYKKLNKLISKYSFAKIAEILIKINNNIEEDDDEKEIIKKIKKVISIIKNKQNIILMILRIFSIKNEKYFKDESDKSKDDIGKEEEVNCMKKSINIKKEENRIKEEAIEDDFTDINKGNKEEKSDKGKSINNIIFKEHYHNDGYNIYCYKPRKMTISSLKCTLYCTETYRQKCNAKCTLFTNSNVTSFTGNHNHDGISIENFYKTYPFLKNTSWKDFQVTIENGNNVLKRLS